MIYIIAIILLTFLSGFFSASEVAFFSLSNMKIKTYEESKNIKKNHIAKLLARPRDLLVTIFMLNTLVNILLQNVASSMFGVNAGWDLKVGVPFVLTLILGEILPKNFGLQKNVWLSNHVVKTINFLQNILAPIRRWTIAVTSPISRLFTFYLKRDKDISKEELEHVLKTSEEHGVLDPNEAKLVSGYLNLQDATVKEIMIPKDEILFYDINTPLNKLIYLFVDEECSRIPVCEGNIEKVIGIITARQYFLHQHMITSPGKIRKVMRQPLFVPENTTSRKLLKRFDTHQEVIAIVVNEYGTISGLITREDLVETVIGPITDLREKKLYTQAGKNELIVSGRLELAEFNDILGVELTSNSNMVTIGGWLQEKMGTIPKTGIKFETDEFLFQILAADPNRIRRLYVRKI